MSTWTGHGGVRLTNRTGVNTGEVVTGDSTTAQRLVTGDAVNTAARLEQAAPANESCSASRPTAWCATPSMSSRRAARTQGQGRAGAAWRLLAVRPGLGQRGAMPRRWWAGREMARLRGAFRAAAEDRRLGTVIGDAGVGKSRLTREFLASVVTRPTPRACLSYGRGITFWPLVEIVRQAAGIEEDDRPEAVARVLGLVGDQAVTDRIAAAIGLSDAPVWPRSVLGRPGLVGIMAERRPGGARVDDIHWAEPTLLELFRFVVEESQGAGAAAVLVHAAAA